MIRGKGLFTCDECKTVFKGLDIEYMVSAFSAPLECPRCHSYHTRPLLSSKMVYKRIWEAHDQNTQP